MWRLYHNDLMKTENLELFVLFIQLFFSSGNLGRELQLVDPIVVRIRFVQYLVSLRVSKNLLLLKYVLSGPTKFP